MQHKPHKLGLRDFLRFSGAGDDSGSCHDANSNMEDATMTTPSNMQEPHNAFERTVRAVVDPWDKHSKDDEKSVAAILAAYEATTTQAVREALERVKATLDIDIDAEPENEPDWSETIAWALAQIDAELAQLNASDGEKHELEKLLRAAIDRINELEGDLAELQGYQKGAGAVIKSRLDELEARYEKHEHQIETDGESINVNTVGHVER